MPQDNHYDPLYFYSVSGINPMIPTFSIGWIDTETTTPRPRQKSKGYEVWPKDQESSEETSEDSKERYVLRKLVEKKTAMKK